MFTQTFLEQIKDAIFQPYFMEGIRAIHEDQVAEGKFKRDIRDYSNGMAALKPTLSEEEMKLLAEYESICEQIREYHAHHAFIAGIYAGFKQIFTCSHSVDAGYHKYVSDEVDKLPNMKRYPELYKASIKRNEIYDKLAEGRVEDCDSPMVCISCYWGEMAASAAANAFYCGYRAASAITDRFGLSETNYEARVMKMLAFEHAFGYIESFSEMERRLERQQNGTWDCDDEDSAHEDPGEEE